jgi:hypothetical protein
MNRTTCIGLAKQGWCTAVALLACACQSLIGEEHVGLEHVQVRWLPSIDDGRTPVQALEGSLGAPSARFEHGRLRCWVLMLVEKGLRVDVDGDGLMRPSPEVDRSTGAARTRRRAGIDAGGECRVVSANDVIARDLWPTWREAEFHLVVVVAADGRIERHSLLRVLP